MIHDCDFRLRDFAFDGGRAHGRWGAGMIPASVLESLYGSPASQQMRDAASELALRIEQGEFDDLDELQRNDLQWLALMLQAWARRVHVLEAVLVPTGADDQPGAGQE